LCSKGHINSEEEEKYCCPDGLLFQTGGNKEKDQSGQFTVG